jgi:hypothetical protein
MRMIEKPTYNHAGEYENKIITRLRLALCEGFFVYNPSTIKFIKSGPLPVF